MNKHKRKRPAQNEKKKYIKKKTFSVRTAPKNKQRCQSEMCIGKILHMKTVNTDSFYSEYLVKTVDTIYF